MYQENVYATYTYCYDGNELSFILVEPIVGMENIDLKPTADEAVIAIPPDEGLNEQGRKHTTTHRCE